MAGKIGRIDELFNLTTIAKQIETVKNGLTETIAMMEKLASASAKTGGTFGNAKGINDTTQANRELAAIEKERQRLEAQLVQTQAKLSVAESDMAKKVAATKAELNAKTRATNEEIKANNLVKGSLVQLENELKKLRGEYEKMSPAQRKLADEQGRGLKAIQSLKSETSSLRKEMGQHQQEVGNYRMVWDKLKGGFLAVTGAIAAASGAIKVVKDVINSTDVTADKFEQTVTGVKFAYDALLRTIATGDWGNLITNMTEANRIGKEFAATLQGLEERKIGQSVMSAESRNRILDFQKTMRDQRLDIPTRVAAAKNALDEENKVLQENSRLAWEALDIQLKKYAAETGAAKATVMQYVRLRNENAAIITQAEQYLDNQKELAALNEKQMRTRGGALDPLSSARQEELTKSIQNTSATVKVYADQVVAKMQTANGAIFEDVGNALVNLQTTQSDFKEGTRRTWSTYTGFLKELGEGTKREVDKAKQKILEFQKTLDPMLASHLRIMAGTSQVSSTMGDIGGNELQGAQSIQAPMFDTGVEQPTSLPGGAVATNVLQQPSAEELMQREADQYATRIGMAAGFVNELGNIMNQYFAGQFMNLDMEDQKAKEKYENDLEMAGNNVRKKNQIEKEYQRQQKERDKERRELEIKQAKFNKTFGIVTAVINGVMAASKDLSQYGFIIGSIFAALDLALMATQIALISKQPIPSYAKGRKGGKAEMAVVGERGSEAIVTADGQGYLTPGKPTLTYLPEGAAVIPHSEVMDIAGRASLSGKLPKYESSFSLSLAELGDRVDGLHRGFSMLAGVVQNKTENHVNITERGFWRASQRGNSWTEYLNDNIRY